MIPRSTISRTIRIPAVAGHMISRSISDNHELARLDARDCMQQLQRMIRPVEHAHDDGSIKRHGNGNQRSLGKT